MHTPSINLPTAPTHAQLLSCMLFSQKLSWVQFTPMSSPQPNFKNFKNFQQSFRYVLYFLATLCAENHRKPAVLMPKVAPTHIVGATTCKRGTKSESFSESCHNKQSVMKSSLWPRSCSHMVERCLRAKAETDTWNQLETNKSGLTEAQENLQNVARGPHSDSSARCWGTLTPKRYRPRITEHITSTSEDAEKTLSATSQNQFRTWPKATFSNMSPA